MEYDILHKSGRGRTATDKAGEIWHAVPRAEKWGYDGRPALCGTTPGRKGNGWGEWIGAEVTCPECLRKLAERA